MSDKTIERYYRGETFPTADDMVKIASVTGMNPDWFILGITPPSRHENEDKDVVFVPRLAVRLSAGIGRCNDQEQEVERIPMALSLIRKLGVKPDKAHIVQADGDSMENTIRDGDDVLIDTAMTELSAEGIYALVIGELAMIKRVMPLFNGGFELISDNDRYRSIEISKADAEQLRVIGRAKWVGRAL
ncbi:S24 family peptidase [Camelimonas lactis]|uniref:S24 family peptidase n=1 Tax=Camelimonas lactis TaxID=659006 RepID=UPI0014054BFA|nr:helix-turn-helix transcriptional regulator [Camelimonas lactis]